jgi:hypothetical protein
MGIELPKRQRLSLGFSRYLDERWNWELSEIRSIANTNKQDVLRGFPW